ncbi:MAG: Spy/CpxP family protein refolding chaperone [Oxalobacter sp.]|nr:Spy/CpxP family protein refolding chaperone [Oxalobacter sp.]
MNKLTRCLIIGTAALGLSASCFAAGENPAPMDSAVQNCECPPPHFKGKKLKGGSGWFGPEARQQRLQKLHDDLKLSSSQEPAWNDYVAVVNKDRGPRGDRPSREDFEKMTAPERLEKMLDGMKRHEARLQERLDATRTFYAKLSDAQKQVFDKEAMPHHPPRHRHGKHRGFRGSRPADSQN